VRSEASPVEVARLACEQRLTMSIGMPIPSPAGGTAGRIRRLAALVPSYARLAWWGLAAPRLGGEGPLVVHQAAVIGPAGLLLAVRNELRGWELPGGSALPGESGERAAQREVLEETGLSVRVERCVAEYVRTGFRPHTARIYRCTPLEGEPRPSVETPRVAWFDPRALPSTLFPWFRGPIADALDPPSEAPLRHEHQAGAAILAGMAIDLRMRWSDDSAR
jgi:8-oxo-dGTP pyrophosphatase MutT (NUDIX family)